MNASPLMVGKLHPDLLKKLVFSSLGTPDHRVIVGPKIGEDAAVIDFKNRVLVVHSDPITGAIKDVGWLAVNICANDIATRGVRPLWILIVILLPQTATFSQLKQITSQIDKAAKELDIAIIGGHTEITAGIKRPILITTAIGEAEKGKFVTSSGAKVGDQIIMTKGAAIEGTAILSTEIAKRLESKTSREILKKAQNFIKRTSIVQDALIAAEVGGVHAMHDATEGGVAGALQEIAWASDVSIQAHEEKIPIYRETEAICRALNIDPLKTIGSGSLIISAHREKAEKIVTTLQKKGIQASIIGKVRSKKNKPCIFRRDGTTLNLSEPIIEEIWGILGKHYR